MKKSCCLKKGVDDEEASQLIKAPGLETELSKWEAGTKVKCGGEAWSQRQGYRRVQELFDF